MSENSEMSAFRNKLDAIKRLVDDLTNLDFAATDLSKSTGEDEMLSLIVEEASKGIDISERFPTFYKELIRKPDLMQAFLDVVDTIEDEDTLAFPSVEITDADSAFLNETMPGPRVSRNVENWSILWQRTVDQLKTLFSPQELLYRPAPNLSEDNWIIVLRDEVEVDDANYMVMLECTIADEGKETLKPVLDIAVTVGIASEKSYFPLRASLHWGVYNETRQISEEGRIKFPDIPLPTVFDTNLENIIAELELKIESIP